ncbi:hypothetical protein EAI_05809 [Harpegnathos saltator]|uniref:Uncharacterized protein n=1 Tax=Harpegnathos saltator TaxID=610380 RepID=E2BTE1_HARSA|nr:hypothetical protein EAI_05809 [Harpegnathos saltator]
MSRSDVVLPNCCNSTLRKPRVRPEAVLGGGSLPSANARKYELDHLSRSYGYVRMAALQNCFKIISNLAGTAISLPDNSSCFRRRTCC